MAENRKRKKRRKKSHNRKAILLVAGLVVCALAVIIGIQVMFRRTISRFDPDIIISGVTVGNTDVSGMDFAQAREAVSRDVEEDAKTAVSLVMEDGRKAETTLEELGMSAADLDEAVQKAVDHGKKGSTADCYKILKSAEKGKNKKAFPLTYEVSEASAGAVLEQKFKTMLSEPENARLAQENGETVVVEEVPGEQVDVPATVDNINQYLRSDRTKRGREIAAERMLSEAEITAEDLEGITDVLGTFTTYYGEGNDGRTMNVESGAGHINGTFMEPGEEVSADKLMAPYTEENGYAMAASYENNEVVESMGGGICQVSTTLYNALLLAELEITERSAHSMQVSYVEPSMDAAIADDVKDLKFKNNTETPVYIEVVLSGGNITFNIYGKETRSESRTVEYVSETLGTVESDETIYVATEDPIGTMYTQNHGKTGLEARLWKVVCENGEEVSREQVNYSYYMASGETVAVGTFSEKEEDSAKINAAVESQDEAYIKEVIAGITGEQ